VENDPQAVRPGPPRGLYPARVDDKGRLKLPAAFKTFLDERGEKDVFVTSFDGRIARIYTPAVWAETEAFLTRDGDDFEVREQMYYDAMRFGADSRLDDQGRILINTELRREMGVENQPIKLMFYRGVIQFWSEATDAEKQAAAGQVSAAERKEQEKKGLK
jgi:MraZ protein